MSSTLLLVIVPLLKGKIINRNPKCCHPGLKNYSAKTSSASVPVALAKLYPRYSKPQLSLFNRLPYFTKSPMVNNEVARSFWLHQIH